MNSHNPTLSENYTTEMNEHPRQPNLAPDLQSGAHDAIRTAAYAHAEEHTLPSALLFSPSDHLRSPLFPNPSPTEFGDMDEVPTNGLPPIVASPLTNGQDHPPHMNNSELDNFTPSDVSMPSTPTMHGLMLNPHHTTDPHRPLSRSLMPLPRTSSLSAALHFTNRQDGQRPATSDETHSSDPRPRKRMRAFSTTAADAARCQEHAQPNTPLTFQPATSTNAGPSAGLADWHPPADHPIPPAQNATPMDSEPLHPPGNAMPWLLQPNGLLMDPGVMTAYLNFLAQYWRATGTQPPQAPDSSVARASTPLQGLNASMHRPQQLGAPRTLRLDY
ncbi:hypothetical protein ONZ51_g2659 [Trametes cubensis]|uniref:Uncharacterized protein n=1 Tax=Trametes cubensis TaxID=1111947 RepID=A0AAD7U1J7_9APHY|nr:hypothetical protein ONZ51_g2659 [Trametes cubensis]